MAPKKQANKQSNFAVRSDFVINQEQPLSKIRLKEIKETLINAIDELYLQSVQAIPTTKLCYSGYDEENNELALVFFFKIRNRNRETWMMQQYKSLRGEFRGIDELDDEHKVSITGFNNTTFSKVVERYESEEDSRARWKRESIKSVTMTHDYGGEDIEFLDERSSWHPWQLQLWDWFFDENNQVKPFDDRVIYHIVDPVGMTGKSKFIKWVAWNNLSTCTKLTYAKSHQIKQSVLDSSAKVFFIDLPRTKGKEDNPRDLACSMEEIKSGHITSCMYGKAGLNFSDPPHVVFFSNQFLDPKLFSPDRWRTYLVNPWDKTLRLVDMLNKDEEVTNIIWHNLLPRDDVKKLNDMSKDHPLYKNWHSAMHTSQIRLLAKVEREKNQGKSLVTKDELIETENRQSEWILDNTKDY